MTTSTVCVFSQSLCLRSSPRRLLYLSDTWRWRIPYTYIYILKSSIVFFISISRWDRKRIKWRWRDSLDYLLLVVLFSYALGFLSFWRRLCQKDLVSRIQLCGVRINLDIKCYKLGREVVLCRSRGILICDRGVVVIMSVSRLQALVAAPLSLQHLFLILREMISTPFCWVDNRSAWPRGIVGARDSRTFSSSWSLWSLWSPWSPC